MTRYLFTLAMTSAVLLLIARPQAVRAEEPVAAVEQLTKSSVEQVAKDFAIACEMSKLSINLAKSTAFKADAADLAYRVAEIMSGAFKTHEVKDVYKNIVVAAPEARVTLWHNAAKELGVKNFRCKTIGFK